MGNRKNMFLALKALSDVVEQTNNRIYMWDGYFEMPGTVAVMHSYL